MTNASLDMRRLANVSLAACRASAQDGQLSLLQFTDWLAGNDDPTDRPGHVSPVIATFARWLCFMSADVRRQELKQIALSLIETNDPQVEERRARHLLDWIICQSLVDDGAIQRALRDASHARLSEIMMGFEVWCGSASVAAAALDRGRSRDIDFDALLSIGPATSFDAALCELKALVFLGAPP